MATVIQVASSTAANSDFTLTLPNPVVADNSIIVGLAVANQAVDILTLSDTNGNVYSIQNTANLSTTAMGLRVWSCPYVFGGPVAPTLTFHCSGSTTVIAFAQEVQGLDITPSPSDISSLGDEGNTADLTSTPIITTKDNDFLFGIACNKSSTAFLVGSDESNLTTGVTGIVNAAIETKIASTAGSNTMNIKQAGAAQMAFLVTSFKAISYKNPNSNGSSGG